MVAAPRSRRRWLWLVPLVLVVVALVAAVAAVITLRVAFSGPALATRVCARLNADMRGRVAIASIDWPFSSVPTVATGGWVPVVLRDVQIRDTDGVVVLRSPQIRAELDVHAVLFGHHDVLARRVVMDDGEIVAREVAAREPAFAGDTEVSLVAAFASRVWHGDHPHRRPAPGRWPRARRQSRPAPAEAARRRRHPRPRGARRLRLDGPHDSVPGLEGTYDCTIDPGPPLERSCDGSASGDVRVLLRLRKLDTW